MKSIFIFNIAVLFLCVGTALSVAVYSEDYGRSRIAGHEAQIYAVTAPDEAKASGAEANISLSPGYFDSALRQFFTSAESGREGAEANFPLNRIFQPMSIFLFGAGLIGVASIARRRFNF